MYLHLCSEESCTWFNTLLLPFEIFNNFIFWACYVSEIQWKSGAKVWAQRDTSNSHVCFCFLSLGSHIVFVIPHEYRILVNLYIQEFRKTQVVQVSLLHLQLSHSDTSGFAFNKRKTEIWVAKEPYHMLSYSHYFSELANYGEKGDTEGKGKAALSYFFFKLFTTYRVQNIDRMYIYQEAKFKSWVSFCVSFLLFW